MDKVTKRFEDDNELREMAKKGISIKFPIKFYGTDRYGKFLSDIRNLLQFAKAIDKGVFPGSQGGPLMHTIAAKAVCFKEALDPAFKVYQQGVIDNAQALCKALMDRDIKIVSGGTDNHLMLVDLTPYDLTGKAMEKLLDAAHITCNKNTIPNDPKSPFVTSGLRLGTPAVTTRGMKEEDMDVIAEAISLVIESEDNVEKVREMVAGLTAKYPLK